MQDDERRGWKNLPGHHRFRILSKSGLREFYFDVLPAGDRALSDHPTPIKKALTEVIAVGDSITAGWGVGNAETFTALISKRYPNVQFYNHGVGGYGTYQSFLTLKDLYSERALPKVVLFAMGKHQDDRNSANRDWRGIVYIYGQRGHVKIPHVRLKGSELVEFPPEGKYPPFWCRYSAFLCGTYYAQFYGKPNAADAGIEENEKITTQLLDQMNTWIKTRSSRLLVIVMDEGSRSYIPFMRERGIPFVTAAPYRCLYDDPHPDTAFHAEVANLVTPVIAPWLGVKPTH